jgi:hypothetical protein
MNTGRFPIIFLLQSSYLAVIVSLRTLSKNHSDDPEKYLLGKKIMPFPNPFNGFPQAEGRLHLVTARRLQFIRVLGGEIALTWIVY